jgi:putative FmdB family regulatory protein
MALRVLDFRCADCGASFEAFIGSEELPACPECSSSTVSRQPTLQVAIRAGTMRRRGRVLDLSSNGCPCGCAGRKPAHR